MRLWNVYYRGSLSSCNYACDYCPFAKTKNTREELKQDQREVERFVSWVGSRQGNLLSLLFTPWGEALGHRYYREALLRLSHMSHVQRVCIQTNLSAPLEALDSACKTTLTLWSTYHPTQTKLARFVERCQQLDTMGLRYSVGIVGLREHLDEMEALRQLLPPEVYLWVNAYKREKDYYRSVDLHRIRTVDPHFDLNKERYPSLGKACSAGESHFTVDGAGDVRRCHFIKDVLLNIYQQEVEDFLLPRVCSQETCGCYIGYVHQPDLKLEELYGPDLLGRIPIGWS